MANRFPLVIDSATQQFKELPSGDNLDMTGSSVVGITSITGATTLSLDSTTTSGVSLGASADAKTITIGNNTVATSVVLNGTAGVSLGTPTIVASTIANNVSLFATTTGTITLGGTGAVTIGAASSTGTINIGTTGTAAAQAINIGTTTSGTITVGGTGATAVQLPTGKTKVGQTFLVQGGAVNITLPTVAGTLVGSGDTTLPSGIVTSSLTSVGTLTGLTVTGTGTNVVSLTTGTTGAMTLDTGSTGAINIGTNANAKTITLGNSSVASTIALQNNITQPVGKTHVTGTLGFVPAGLFASWQNSIDGYTQLVLQNTSTGTTASSDVVVCNNNSTDSTYYGDFGINGGSFGGSTPFTTANNVYLTSTSSHLAIGTTTAHSILFVTNSGAAAAMTIDAGGNTTLGAGKSLSLTGSTSGTVSLLTPATTTSYNLTFPAAAGTSGQVVTTTGSGNLAFTTLDLTYMPDAAFKKSCRVATTAALTINTAQTTIDGITITSTDRVLVKDQATPSQNGIYTGLTTTTWTRVGDGDTASEIAGAIVNVDEGTANGGKAFKTTFKVADTIGTTNMLWNRLVDANASTSIGVPTTANGVDIAVGGNTIQLATGAVTDLAMNTMSATTITSVAASTYTRASTLYIGGAPVASTNATITSPYALYIASGNTYAGGGLSVGAGTATVAPVKLTAGTNLTTAAAGAIEYDGNITTITPNTSIGRATVPVAVYTSGAGTVLTLNAEVTPQILFPAANDTITLPVGTYHVTMVVNCTRAATATTSAALQLKLAGSGTAVGTFSGISVGSIAAGGAASTFILNGISIATSTSMTAANATAAGVYNVLLTGIMRITTAGTFIPQYNYSASLVSATGANSVAALNHMVIKQIATNGTAASTGAWA